MLSDTTPEVDSPTADAMVKDILVEVAVGK